MPYQGPGSILPGTPNSRRAEGRHPPPQQVAQIDGRDHAAQIGNVFRREIDVNKRPVSSGPTDAGDSAMIFTYSGAARSRGPNRFELRQPGRWQSRMGCSPLSLQLGQLDICGNAEGATGQSRGSRRRRVSDGSSRTRSEAGSTEL